jgi:hypothetical protein
MNKSTGIKKKYFRYILLVGAISILFALYAVLRFGSDPEEIKRSPPPYPPSPVIATIDFDLSSLRREAPGSDIWTTTWADDGNLYTSWGDGGGFGGTNRIGRVSMGVARIEGDAEHWKGSNIWGGSNPESDEKPFPGKAVGMLSVDGDLYMSVSKQDVWTVGKMAKSTNKGRRWISGGWDFELQTNFIDFGKNFEWARDHFVYSYGNLDSQNLFLMRVPKDKIMTREAYEFTAGLNADGEPIWTGDPKKRKSVFTDQNGVGWGVRVVYNKAIGRYLLSVFHGSENGDGSWGIFDAPEPWGPWTTVAYYTNWIDKKPKFCFQFPSKWISPDGKTLWMIFSGVDIYDSVNVLKAALRLKTAAESSDLKK